MAETPSIAVTAHRLFFALVPEADVRRALAALAADVARAAGGRAPRAQNLHLTVAFLGDVPGDHVPAVLDFGARAAAGTGAFVLALDRVGSFRDAGIAWAAAQVIPPPLQRIFEALREGMQAEGLRVERRAFHPHVTLARRCTRPLPAREMPPVAWPVATLVLMASTTLPEGPHYAQLASWRLAADEGTGAR